MALTDKSAAILVNCEPHCRYTGNVRPRLVNIPNFIIAVLFRLSTLNFLIHLEYAIRDL